MRASDSPFPCHWWGTGLENAGLGEVRPNVGTYGQYDFDRLPPVPFAMNGDFAWLASAAAHDRNIGVVNAAQSVRDLRLLLKASARLKLRLPASFTRFMETSALHQRIRSNTDCFLDLCPEPIRSPKDGGYVVRFLSDSQACLFWYLYLTPDGSDHAVVSSSDFYGAQGERGDQDKPPDPTEIAFCAESFETFVCRFWLENEIWYAEWKKTPMPDVGLEYIERYRRKEG